MSGNNSDKLAQLLALFHTGQEGLAGTLVDGCPVISLTAGNAFYLLDLDQSGALFHWGELAQKAVKGDLPANFLWQIDSGTTIENLLFSADFFALVNRVQSSELNYQKPLKMERFCTLRVVLEGDIHEQVDEVDLKYERSIASFLNFTGGVNYHYRGYADRPLTSIVLFFKPESLSALLGDITPAQQALLDSGNAQSAQAHLVSFSITPAFMALATDIVSVGSRGPYYLLQQECRFKELLIMGMEAVDRNSEGEGGAIAISDREVEALSRTKEWLDQHYLDQPTLEQLCQISSLNRRKLTEGFRALHGCTIRDYLVGCRMDLAKSLLEQGINVGIVADRVGYTDQGSLTKAFKRHFGALPKDV